MHLGAGRRQDTRCLHRPDTAPLRTLASDNGPFPDTSSLRHSEFTASWKMALNPLRGNSLLVQAKRIATNFFVPPTPELIVFGVESDCGIGKAVDDISIAEHKGASQIAHKLLGLAGI